MDIKDDDLKKIQFRIGVLEASLSIFRDQMKSISDGETKSNNNIKYFITTAITLGTITFAAAGLYNFHINSSEISDKLSFEISKVEEKLKNIGDKGEVLSSSTFSSYRRNGYVLGIPYVSRDRVDEIYTYTLKIQFNASVSIVGSSTNVYGVNRKYDGTYAEYMSRTSDQSYFDILRNGGTFYFDNGSFIIEGFPINVTWSESITVNKCAEILSILNKMKNDANIGSVYIVPIIDNIKNKPEPAKFDIEIGDVSSVHSCSDFK